MTQEELTKIESELEKRGYKKYTTCLTSTETYAWFKTFDKETNEDGEVIGGYQVAFRVWDWTQHHRSLFTYGFDMWASPFSADRRMDLETNWEPFCDIDTLESMAKDFYQFTCKYTNNGKDIENRTDD